MFTTSIYHAKRLTILQGFYLIFPVCRETALLCSKYFQLIQRNVLQEFKSDSFTDFNINYVLTGTLKKIFFKLHTISDFHT